MEKTPLNPYSIHIDLFEGPLDLLLHLIKQKEVPIEKVEMSEIAEQYLQIIAQTRFLDLEVAAEYLVVAATLMAIKSRLLLPSGDGLVEDELQVEPDEGFYEELKRRLRDYETTKARAYAFLQMPQMGIDVYQRGRNDELRLLPREMEDGQDVLDLGQMFFKLLKRVGELGNQIRIKIESVSIVSFMMGIVDGLKQLSPSLAVTVSGNSSVGLWELTSHLYRDKLQEDARPDSPVSRRGVVIGSFIAVLELTKRGMVRCSVNDNSVIGLSSCYTEGGVLDIDDVDSNYDRVTDSSQGRGVFGAGEVRDIGERAIVGNNILDIGKFRERRADGGGSALANVSEEAASKSPYDKEVGNI